MTSESSAELPAEFPAEGGTGTDTGPHASASRLLLPASLSGPVWIVSPHPDDESLGCGALLAELTDLGTEVWALLITDGGASHLASRSWPRERRVNQRLAEWHVGLDILGVRPARRLALALPDGELPSPLQLSPPQPGAQQSGTRQAGVEAAVATVRAALAHAPPATVLLPWRRDSHPDHRAAHALLSGALVDRPSVRLLEYTVWLQERGVPDDLPRPDEARCWHAEVTGQVGRKERAIRAHHSQLGKLILDDPGGFVLPEDMIGRSLERREQFWEVEL